MALYDYMILVRYRWRLFAAVLLLVLVITGAAVTLIPPRWSTTATLYFTTSSNTAATAEAGGQTSLIPQTIISSFAEAAESDLVLGPVIRDLDLNLTASQLAGKVDAVSPLGTSIVSVKVTDTSPERAPRIANRLADELSDVATQLAPSTTEPSVRLVTIAPAGQPTAPSFPKKALSMVLAFGWGSALAFVLCVWQESRVPLVRTRRDVEAVTTIPLIGYLPRESAAERDPNARRPRHDSASRVQWGQLRTNFMSLREGYDLRSVLFVAASDARPTRRVAEHLAATMASGETRVLLVDADLRHRQEAAIGPGLSSILRGESSLDMAAVARPGYPAVLGAGPPVADPGAALSSPDMVSFLAAAENQYDLVLFSAPPLTANSDAAALAQVVDAVMMVADQQPMSSGPLRRTLSSLHLAGARVRGLVLAG